MPSPAGNMVTAGRSALRTISMINGIVIFRVVGTSLLSALIFDESDVGWVGLQAVRVCGETIRWRSL